MTWTPAESAVTRGERRCMLVAVAVGAVLRLLLLNRHGISSTELITWHVMGMSPWDLVVERLEANHVPLYFASLRAWCAVFGRSVVALRLPSALLGIASVPAAWWLARRLFSSRTALMAAWIVAVHPYWIHTSLEARVYGPLMLACLLAAAFFWRWVETSNWKWAVAYLVAAGVAIATQMLAITLVVSLTVWYLASARRQRTGARPLRPAPWLVAPAPLLLLTPLVVVWSRMQEKVGGQGWQWPEGGGRIRRDLLRMAFGDYDFIGYFTGIGADLARGMTVPLMALTLLGILGIRIRKKWMDGDLDARRRSAIDLLLWCIALPPLCLYAATVKSDGLLGIARYQSVAATFLPLLIAAVATGLPERWMANAGKGLARIFRRPAPVSTRGIRGVWAGLILFAIAIHTVGYMAYPGDGIRAAVRQVTDSPRDGDRLLTVAGGGLPYVAEYFELAIPHHHIWRNDDDETEITQEIRQFLTPETRRLFVLSYHADDSPVLDILDKRFPGVERMDKQEISEAKLFTYRLNETSR